MFNELFRFLGRPDREDPLIQTIEADGVRFRVRFQYDPDPYEGDWTYPGYTFDLRMIKAGKTLPISNEPDVAVPSDFYPVRSFEITDKTRGGKKIDVMSLLPHDWSILAVSPRIDYLTMVRGSLRARGVSEEEIDLYQRMILPIGSLPDDQTLRIPITRFPQENKPNEIVDWAVELVVYNIGQAQASITGLDEPASVNEFARRYLQETLGGNLHLLQQG